MFMTLFMWASLCATAPVAHHHEATPADTTECSVAAKDLDEIIVRSSPITYKTDRTVIRPDKATRMAATDGVDLLRRLRLPLVTVNPLYNSIALATGGKILLCINGVEATPSQITAVSPADVIRVEFHENPGVRYAGAAAVIDYITTRHNSGGEIMADAFGAFASERWATIDHMSAQYNKGQSVWSVNAGYMGQRKDRWVRDYDETWHYPDATISRHESGLPVTVGGSGLESALNYNRLLPSGHMLNVRLGFDLSHTPNQEEGDRRAILVTSQSDDRILVEEHTSEHSVRPSLGVHYRHRLGKGRSLLVDAQGSYMRSSMLHSYREDGIGERSRVDGGKYTSDVLVMLESSTGSRTWSAGLSNRNSIISNGYEAATVRVRQSETALAGEYADRFGNWGLTANGRLTYGRLAHAGTCLSRLAFLPSASVSFHPARQWFLRYNASLDRIMPSAAEISDISLPIQTGMMRRGNPGLRPFMVIAQSLTASFESRPATVEARISYRHEQNPVMESVIFEEGTFVRTFFNQRSFRRLTAGVSVSLRPWTDHLTLSAEPVLSHYVSHGKEYRHRHNIFRLGLGVDFSYGHWLAYGNVITGPANRMYGEEITEEKDMNQIMVGYKRGGWTVHLGIFNAFMRDYWMETRNLSALTPYTSRAHSARSSSYVALKVGMTLGFGRKGRDVGPHATPAPPDNDSGILTVTK